MPSASAFQGKGIVMSGGAKHVLQALANLDVLRSHRSYLPVEFWHAFELEDAHCEALAASGAVCRQLQVPGVYKGWSTVLPAVMSSSFQHVLWMDTDVTPLMAPDILFETEAYKQNGALFWPDHWSQDCYPFGESSWPNHVALQLLQLKHNKSDLRFSHEQETGTFLIDKQNHWRAICLANYLASRYFFTRVLYGPKDTFRLAFLKLNVSTWVSTVRPGLAGTFQESTGMFHPFSMVQFWPCEEDLGDGRAMAMGRHIPLYIHQKLGAEEGVPFIVFDVQPKKHGMVIPINIFLDGMKEQKTQRKKLPGLAWKDFVTFQQPMGQCIHYQLQPLDLTSGDPELWNLADTYPMLAKTVFDAEALWENSFADNLERLQNHPGLSNKGKDGLTFPTNPFRSKQWDTMPHSCRCDFGNNMWLHLLTFLRPGQVEGGMTFNSNLCKVMLHPGFDPGSCPVGFATLAVLCSRIPGTLDDRAKAQEVATALPPRLGKCLNTTFWPVKLQHLKSLAAPNGRVVPSLAFDPEVVKRLAQPLQRCLPLKVPECWHPMNAWSRGMGVMKDTSLGVKNSCVLCCGTGDPSDCFDEFYSEEVCCNKLDVQ